MKQAEVGNRTSQLTPNVTLNVLYKTLFPNTLLAVHHTVTNAFNPLAPELPCALSKQPEFKQPSFTLGHAVAQWLRHCATNRKVAGLIPDGVIGTFH
jgi:hypothetical protein